jgi:hypothetical protein
MQKVAVHGSFYKWKKELIEAGKNILKLKLSDTYFVLHPVRK